MLDPHDVVISSDFISHIDIVSEPEAQHFSVTFANRGMTQLVKYTHNKCNLLDVVSFRNHSSIVSTRPRVYDPCLSDTW